MLIVAMRVSFLLEKVAEFTGFEGHGFEKAFAVFKVAILLHKLALGIVKFLKSAVEFLLEIVDGLISC
jgi:hypothetical protein